MQVPPFLQGDSTQSSMFCSHWRPVKPTGHVHSKSSTRSVHVPWFMHGLEKQSLSVCEQSDRKNPVKQSHMKLVSVSVQSPLPWQGSGSHALSLSHRSPARSGGQTHVKSMIPSTHVPLPQTPSLQSSMLTQVLLTVWKPGAQTQLK